MKDNSLTTTLALLEKEIGKKRVSALRREALRRNVSIKTLLGAGVIQYLEKLEASAA